MTVARCDTYHDDTEEVHRMTESNFKQHSPTHGGGITRVHVVCPQLIRHEVEMPLSGQTLRRYKHCEHKYIRRKKLSAWLWITTTRSFLEYISCDLFAVVISWLMCWWVGTTLCSGLAVGKITLKYCYSMHMNVIEKNLIIFGNGGSRAME